MNKHRKFFRMVVLLSSLFVVLSVVVNFVYAASFDSKTALRFDGHNDMVLVVDDGSFDFADAFTVEAWVKPYVLGSDISEKSIVMGTYEETAYAPSAWSLHLDKNDYSNVLFDVCTPTCVQAQSGPGGLTVDDWTHVAGVFTSDGRVLLYLDGELVDSQTHTGEVYPSNYLRIGLGDTAFNGWIDEVRVWNDERTVGELNAGLNHLLTGNDSNLAAYYRFDEGGGQWVHDRSGNGLTGRLGAMTEGDVRDPYFVVANAPLFYVMDQYFNEHNYGFYLTDSQIRCQEFRPTVAPLLGVELYIGITGNPGDLFAEIRTMDDTVLTSTPSVVGTPQGVFWITFNFDEPVLLTPGQKYQICLNTSQPYVLSDYYSWYGHTSSTYECADCSTNLPSWPDFDFNFRTLNLPVDPIYLPLITR